VCHGPAETLGKAGSMGSSLCRGAGTRNTRERCCAQGLSGKDSVGKIVQERVRQEESCHAGLARGWARMLHFSYRHARRSARIRES